MYSTRLAALFTVSVAFSATARATDVGSDPIDRPFDDGSSGVTIIYRGTTQPVSGPGQVASVQFFNNENPQSWVTPMLFEITAPHTYTLVGVGASIQANASGLQGGAFTLISGTATLSPGKFYTIGFQTARYEAPATPAIDPIFVSSSSGLIDYVGFELTSDPWSYALNAFPSTLGDSFAPVGTPADFEMDTSPAFSGRIYSARFTIRAEAPLCRGDVDLDTDIDFDDLNRVLNVFGQTNTGGDADGDGDTDFDDLNLVLSNFGNFCA